MKTKKCKCRICKRTHYFNSFLKRYKFSVKDTKWLEDIFGELLEAENDLDYYKCILNGQWPNSVKILTNALENAKTKEKEEQNKQNINRKKK